ncbi:MAG TPA: DUF433 domain-containing protein [Candidatus Acidoferrum sp.]|nr:DUF433 domain-containing protein [Candidatus Acidoferrum sp.]
MPIALGEILPLLARSPDRLRILLDVLTTFDVFESMPALLRYIASSGDLDAVICAANLAPNPGVNPADSTRLQQLIDSMRLSNHDRNVLAIRLDPSAEPTTQRLALLRAQLWPGTRSGEGTVDSGLAPIVAVDEINDSADFRWQLIGDLISAGAVVRRLPATWLKEPQRAWLGGSVVVLSWSGEAAMARLAPFSSDMTVAQFLPADVPTNKYSRERLLRQIDNALRGPRLRIAPDSRDVPDMMERDSYRLGSFDAREMVYLAGSRSSTLQRLRLDLEPKELNSGLYWSFNQLVALRTWEFWRRETGRFRLPTDVLRGLVAFQGAETPTQVAVTGDGRVLVASGQGFVDWKTGQVVSEDFVRLDRVFQPQTFGGRRPTPALPTPSAFTRVHPGVVGGTPCVDGYRVPARAIAGLAMEGVNQIEKVLAVYPEIPEPAILDAIAVGGQVLHPA